MKKIMMYKLRKFALTVVIVLLGTVTHLNAFVAGTEVKTPNGYKKIELLQVGDEVCSFDVKSKTIVLSKIIHITTSVRFDCVKYDVENEQLVFSDQQLFWNEKHGTWIRLNEKSGNDQIWSLAEVEYVPIFCKFISPQLVYDLVVEPYHNFYVTKKDLIVHNFAEVMSIAPVAAVNPFGAVIIGSLALFGVTKTIVDFLSKKEKRKRQLLREREEAFEKEKKRNSGKEPNEEDSEERKINEIEKKEFFKKIKNQYEHFKNDIYRKIKGCKGIDRVKFFKWDYTHKEAEGFDKRGIHLGAYNPKTLTRYKQPVPGRNIIKHIK